MHAPARTHALTSSPTSGQEMELTESLSRASTSQEMEEAPPLTGLADDEFDFGAIGDELGPEVRLLRAPGSGSGSGSG